MSSCKNHNKDQKLFLNKITEFLFGNLNETFNHPKNYISLLIKKYIWATKFKSANLSIVGIKNFIKSCLRELQIIFD